MIRHHARKQKGKSYVVTLGGGAGTAKRSRPLVGTFALIFFGSLLHQGKKEQAINQTMTPKKVRDSTKKASRCNREALTPQLFPAFYLKSETEPSGLTRKIIFLLLFSNDT